jgi:hypothetical protein
VAADTLPAQASRSTQLCPHAGYIVCSQHVGCWHVYKCQKPDPMAVADHRTVWDGRGGLQAHCRVYSWQVQTCLQGVGGGCAQPHIRRMMGRVCRNHARGSVWCTCHWCIISRLASCSQGLCMGHAVGWPHVLASQWQAGSIVGFGGDRPGHAYMCVGLAGWSPTQSPRLGAEACALGAGHRRDGGCSRAQVDDHDSG